VIDTSASGSLSVQRQPCWRSFVSQQQAVGDGQRACSACSACLVGSARGQARSSGIREGV
jgi:hypothetical protein